MRDRSHPLELLRQAAARRDQAGVRRGQACLRLAGRASLTDDDFAAAARALAAVREHGK
jgi:hypothetical protein